MHATLLHLALAATAPLFGLGAQALAPATQALGNQDQVTLLRRLRQERAEALAQVLERCRQRHAQGLLAKDEVDAAHEAWAEAALEAASTHQERLVLLKDRVALEKDRCQAVRQRVDLGTASREDLLRAQAKRLSREIALLQAQMAGPRASS